MPSRIQLRRDTLANWNAINPILAAGEPGIDTTLDLMKYGDGVTPWVDLPYSSLNPNAVGNLIPAFGNTYNLGNATNTWKSLYVSGNVSGNASGNGIFLGNIQLGSNETQLLINGIPVAADGADVTFNDITAGNVSTTGDISAGNVSVTNDVEIGGNLTVSGNTIFDNVTSFNVEDPIIGLGRAANNQPLTNNDGMDRGEQLWYYTSSEKSAFIGLDNSAGKLTAAVDVTITNEIVSVNNYGNFVVGNVEGAAVSVTGNITADNTVSANTISANTLSINTAVITNSVSVTGNVTANYFVGNGSALTSTMTDRGPDLNNWNTMTQMGVYTVNRVSWSGTVGTPLDSQVFVGLVEVMNSTGTALSQIFYPGTVDSGNVKIQWNRTYWGGSWSSWIKIINDDQVVLGGTY